MSHICRLSTSTWILVREIYSDSEADDYIRPRTDKYTKPRYFKPEDFDVIERAVEIAQEKEVTPSQISLDLLISKDYVTSPILA